MNNPSSDEQLRRELNEALDWVARMKQALRVIADLDPDWTHRDDDSVYGIARNTLQEVEARKELLRFLTRSR